MDSLTQALDAALPVWEGLVARSGWPQALLALAYLGAAWLCLLHARLARTEWRAQTLGCLVVLGLLGANTVLSVDLFLAHFMRSLAGLQGWYEQRRGVQHAALALLVLGALLWQRRAGRADDERDRPLRYGVLALGLLFALRMVSAHSTDALLALRLAGISAGRWLELAVLLWLACAAGRRLATVRGR